MKKIYKQRLEYVASLPCCICGDFPIEVHHIRLLGEKRNHMKTIPLCVLHHRGRKGIHYLGKKEWRRRYGHETDFL